MEIFLSWSGRRSKAAAEALRIWLPKVNPAFKPWLSTADIDKGARWATDVAERLEAARAGIICLTPSNLHADWVLWEAGALSKTIKNTHVCTLLIGLDPSDVKPPLSQFQGTRMVKEDMLALLSTLNSKLEDRAIPASNLPETFSLWWPKLEAELNKLPHDENAIQPQRPEHELIEEILALVRSQTRPAPAPSIEVAAVPTSLRLANRITDYLVDRYEIVSKVEMTEAGSDKWLLQAITDRGTFTLSVQKGLPPETIAKTIASMYREQSRDVETVELEPPALSLTATARQRKAVSPRKLRTNLRTKTAD